ncbi:MAG: hypothetical protein HY827_00560 [Actinobacteria bacterium]|nr:hypothetical protein [Actinomycetota bacterium]
MSEPERPSGRDGSEPGTDDGGERLRRARVPLPEGAEPPFEVFVNGVPQREGHDYEIENNALYFFAGLRREGKLGFIRWLSITLAIAGTYRQNDSVDVTFVRGGRGLVETGLPIEVLVDEEEQTGPARGSYSPG